MTETDIQNRIRLRLNAYGRYFRNNTGLLKDKQGRPVRFGLCVGSSDLIGWTEVDGIAVFTAIEVKRPKGKATDKQLRFISQVREAGGIAFIARSDDDAERVIVQEIKEIRERLNTPT